MSLTKLFRFFVIIFLTSCSGNSRISEDIIPPAPDYGNPVYWFGNLSEETGKPVDIFYVYPTLGTVPVNDSGDTLLYANIDKKAERDAAFDNQRFNQVVYAGGEYNFYAPFYRQITMSVYSMGSDIIAEKSKIPSADISAAFQYYMQHLNNGKPFILLGHSQGSAMLLELLKNTITPSQLRQMVAAYLMGYEITSDELHDYAGKLIPARDSSDVHCIVLYNSLTSIDAKSPGMQHSAVGINPLNWKTDSTFAPREKHLGMAQYDSKSQTYELIPRVTGGYLQEHYMICTDIDPLDCYQESLADMFPLGNLHFMDSWLYAGNIKQNIKTRTTAYFEENKL